MSLTFDVHCLAVNDNYLDIYKTIYNVPVVFMLGFKLSPIRSNETESNAGEAILSSTPFESKGTPCKGQHADSLIK